MLDDDFADGGAAGEGDFIYVGMLNQRSAASFSEAGDDVDYARGQAAIGKVFCELESCERSLLCGFENAGAARGDCRPASTQP